MKSIDEYFFFEAVVRCGGFSSASRSLNVSKSSLSRQVRQLEQRLGLRLIERTTTQFEVTEAGRTLYTRCKTALAELQAGEEEVSSLSEEPSGTLRVATPGDYLADIVFDVVEALLAKHEKLRIEVAVVRNPINVFSEKYDVALRARPNLDTEVDLIVKQIARLAWHFVASPAYLEKWGYPDSPSALKGLPTIGTSLGAPHIWRLISKDDQNESIEFHPVFSTDSIRIAVRGAVSGLGVALVPDTFSCGLVKSGELVHILPKWRTDDFILHMVFPSRRGMLPSVRLFLDAVAKALRSSEVRKSLALD